MLDAFPVMNHDEPWIASGAAKLANEGVYGTDLFSGFWGMERHIYVYMPVYSLLQPVVFWVCGVGIWQMRLTPVLCGAIVLLLVFAAGSQRKDRRVGLLAMALLLTLRVAAGQDESADVILMDDNMRTVFDRAARPTDARHEQYLSYLEFLAAHEVELAATVEDPTYGTMRILRVPRNNR